jgi:hypothetical protein
MYYLDLLKKMLADMDKAPACYQATRYWKVLIPSIVSDLQHYGFENFKCTPSANKFWIGVEDPSIGLLHYSTFLYHDSEVTIMQKQKSSKMATAK